MDNQLGDLVQRQKVAVLTRMAGLHAAFASG